MRALSMSILAIMGTVGLIADGIAQIPPGQPSEDGAGHTLTRAEECIVRDPRPAPAAAEALIHNVRVREQYLSWVESLPQARRPQNPDSGGMGWAVSDADYWRQIPAPARAIPLDWSSLPVVRFTNTQLAGRREIRLSSQGEYDLWLLNDPLHGLTACVSVNRKTRRIWFMEIARQVNGTWAPKRAKDPCYACHPSGPRIIRPLDEPGLDATLLSRFNRRMLAYGACDFGGSVDRAARGSAVVDDRCSGCHNAHDRGTLFDIHRGAMKFKTKIEQSMPIAE